MRERINVEIFTRWKIILIDAEKRERKHFEGAQWIQWYDDLFVSCFKQPSFVWHVVWK